MLLLKMTIVMLTFSCYNQSISAVVLDKCEIARELASAGISRSFIGNFMCLIQNESDFNTSKKAGPGHKASFSYGIFQISSDEWCNAWRPGGYCNKTCSDFLDNNIKDDIVCAEKIWKMRGFKHWNGWMKNCKNKKLPDISRCLGAKEFSDGNTFDQLMDDNIRILNQNSQILRLHLPQFGGNFL